MIRRTQTNGICVYRPHNFKKLQYCWLLSCIQEDRAPSQLLHGVQEFAKKTGHRLRHIGNSQGTLQGYISSHIVSISAFTAREAGVASSVGVRVGWHSLGASPGHKEQGRDSGRLLSTHMGFVPAKTCVKAAYKNRTGSPEQNKSQRDGGAQKCRLGRKPGLVRKAEKSIIFSPRQEVGTNMRDESWRSSGWWLFLILPRFQDEQEEGQGTGTRGHQDQGHSPQKQKISFSFAIHS